MTFYENSFSRKFKAHPWHGVSAGLETKDQGYYCNAYIEMTPSSQFKLELDKQTGLMVVDRPRKFSNNLPCCYGFIPQSYCGSKVADHSKKSIKDSESISIKEFKGDQDPLDICVFSSNNLFIGDILLQAKVLGGYRMIDNEEIDDKIIAVLKDDPLYGEFTDISQFPNKMIDRLKHYFLTYKQPPDSLQSDNHSFKINIIDTYHAKEAYQIISLACEDYQRAFS